MRGLNPIYPYRLRFESFFSICGQILNSAEHIYDAIIELANREKQMSEIYSNPHRVLADNNHLKFLVMQQLDTLDFTIYQYYTVLLNVDTLALRTEKRVNLDIERIGKEAQERLRKIAHEKYSVIKNEDEFEAMKKELENARSELNQKLAQAYSVLLAHITRLLGNQYLEAKIKDSRVLNMGMVFEKFDFSGPEALKHKMKTDAINITQLKNSLDKFANVEKIADFDVSFNNMLSELEDIDRRDMHLSHHLEVSLGHVGAIISGNPYLSSTKSVSEYFSKVHENFKRVFKNAVKLELRAKIDIPKGAKGKFDIRPVRLKAPKFKKAKIIQLKQKQNEKKKDKLALAA